MPVRGSRTSHASGTSSGWVSGCTDTPRAVASSSTRWSACPARSQCGLPGRFADRPAHQVPLIWGCAAVACGADARAGAKRADEGDGMKPTTPRRTGLAALLRRWRPDRNPLRRTADRAEAVVMAALLLAFLACAPLAALAASHGVASAGARAERAEAGWHRVRAVLLQSALEPAHARFQAALLPTARARWTAPDGAQRTGVVYAPRGATAGATVTVWTNDSGQPTGVPVQPVDVTARTILAASVAVGVVAALASCAGLLAHWLLDRRRLAAWDAEWSQTGPQWTGQRLRPCWAQPAALAVILAPHRPALGANEVRPAGGLATFRVRRGLP